MNKVIQVNLSGTAFTFDDDAYGQLDDYLARLNSYFRGSPGHTEIMHDIEARLAELFLQGMKGRSIVSHQDVRSATATLGQPEDLASESFASEPEAASNSSSDFGRRGESSRSRESAAGRENYANTNTAYTPYGKRLMRDGEDKIVGGVCAGVSSYFGIENPIWMRIAFAAAVLGAGVGLVPYIVLWIVMPEARSAADRLAMRGEPIDLEHLSRQVEREANQFGERVSRWGDDFSSSSNSWSNKFQGFGRCQNQGTRRPPKSSEEMRSQYRDEGYMV